jgi:hypothetical protein
MFSFSRRFSWLGLVLGILSTWPALAQSAINKPWGHTDLDSLVSVHTPYRAQDIQEAGVPWLTAFFTKGSYHHFVMMRVDVKAMLQQQLEANPRKNHLAQSDSGAVTTLTLDIDKCLRAMIKSPLLAIVKPKMSREYVVSMPVAPGGQASHRVYKGIDPDSREAALMDVQWFGLQDAVYFFFCTTVDPDGEAARQEKQRYFSTIQVGHL